MGLLSWLSLDKKRGSGNHAAERATGAGPRKKSAPDPPPAIPESLSPPSSEEEEHPRKKIRIEMPTKTRRSNRTAAAEVEEQNEEEQQQHKENGKLTKQHRRIRKEEEIEEEEEKRQPKQRRHSLRAGRKESQQEPKQRQSSMHQQTEKELHRGRRGAPPPPPPPSETANGVSEKSRRRPIPHSLPPHRQRQEKQQQKQPKKEAREASRKRRRERERSVSPPVARLPSASPAPRPKSTSPVAPAPTTTGGMKRVRSSWRLRPLIVDEKLRVFVEGRDENELLMYDGGDFWAWLRECEEGKADPTEGLPYPLVVQDEELRTVLEIKEPAIKTAAAAAAAATAPAVKAAKRSKGGEDGGITVPTWRILPVDERPDVLLRAMDPRDVPVVHRNAGGDSPSPDIVGRSPAAVAAAAAWSSAQAALASDPPYIRYVQPTPDDQDLAIEYDLDEEDEEWLAEYNKGTKKTGTKARSSKRPVGEEWLEHLVDRMEKEYTAELQRNPEKWVLGAGGGTNVGDDAAPEVSLPPIEEIFPLEKCLQVQGINHYEGVIRAVYGYWKEKHRRAGRPLIPRLWYEPPWDRKAAARRLAAAGEDGDGVFAGHDSPLALAGIRKRRMEASEVRARFESIRRDLEAARTLADQVRKREKLKRREAQLLKEEWAARMQDVADGQRIVLVKGRLKDRPPQVHALQMLNRADAQHSLAAAAHTATAILGFNPFDHGGEVMPITTEDRAARLAARRDARDAAAAGLAPPPRPLPGSRSAPRQHFHRMTVLHPAHGASPLRSGASGGGVRGPRPGPGVAREAHCVWCGASDSIILGCSRCHRCFCFKCFQRRPGYGINNWSRAVKDPRYECVVCRGLENEEDGDLELREMDLSANTADDVIPGDGADTTGTPVGRGRSRTEGAAVRAGAGSTVAAAVAAQEFPKVQQPRRATGQFAPFPRQQMEKEAPFSSGSPSLVKSAKASKKRKEQENEEDVEVIDVSSDSDSESDSDSDSDSDSGSEEESSGSEREDEVDIMEVGGDDGGSGSILDGAQDEYSPSDVEEEAEPEDSDVFTEAREGSSSEDESSSSSSEEEEVEERGTKKGSVRGAATVVQQHKENREPRAGGKAASARDVPIPRRTPRRRGQDSSATEGEGGVSMAGARPSRSVMPTVDLAAAFPAGKKVPRELVSLLRRKSRSRAKKEVQESDLPATAIVAAVRARKAANKAAATSGEHHNKNRRNGSGISRADVEIMLQRPIVSPSRKLRSTKR